ncbi:hypothetical protein F511_05853 [Dorcoceras hygrometricum]|uniref:Uncharacterized protein n=1 Tax=Dorcoceras hygrometricum TaxID=472368 RepID=A0A2Z7CZT4_9LAMI|nr:hypothetical protein F511_05853 [Dorcoceras hygrometricum]
MNAPRAHKECACEKTNTPSTSKPKRAKNSAKLVKVLRDLAVEIRNHAAKMEKVVEEIGEILEDMAVSDDEYSRIYCSSSINSRVSKTMPITLLEEEQVKAFDDHIGRQLEKTMDIIIRSPGHAKDLSLVCKISIQNNKFSQMAVCSKIGSEDTVTSKYVVPMIYLSSDEDEGLYVEGPSTGRKKKLRNMGVHSPVASEKRKG